MNRDVKTSFKRYLTWCKTDALPFWIDNGVARDGRFWERLDGDGVPFIDLDQRVYVQCRQCLVFSEASNRNWHSAAKIIAIKGLSTLISRIGFSTLRNSPFKGVPYSLLTTGGVHDPRSDLYTYGFVLLTLAQYINLVDEEVGISCADELMRFLDGEMSSDHGGWVESLPAAVPRRQNPHMHLFEAMLAMYECTGIDRYGDCADKLVELFRERFLHPKQPYRLLEFFNNDWSADQHTGHLIEPGHMFEWVWLLKWYEKLDRNEHSIDLEHLFDQAVSMGLPADKTRVINSVDMQGNLVDSGSRYWPQTEAVKAALALSNSEDHQRLNVAIGVLNTLMDSFLGQNAPNRGGWVDGLDKNGEAVKDFNSASAFYHYVGLAAEIEDFLSAQEENE